jgi:uncharacterized membrane protein YdjX (TVP38/TMEM64 family)
LALDRRVLRLVILLVVILTVVVTVHVTGVSAQLSQARVRELVQSAGAWGIVLYILAFTVGELLHLPGIMFLGAAVMAFGRVRGGILAYFASIIAVQVVFLAIRAIGGQPLDAIKNARIRAILAKLDERPLLTVIAVRMIGALTPAVTYALALSNVRFRDHLIGTTIGLIPPIIFLAGLMGIFFH